MIRAERPGAVEISLEDSCMIGEAVLRNQNSVGSGPWKPLQRPLTLTVVKSVKNNDPDHLQLDVGDTVEVHASRGSWFRGLKTKDIYYELGIFPSDCVGPVDGMTAAPEGKPSVVEAEVVKLQKIPCELSQVSSKRRARPQEISPPTSTNSPSANSLSENIPKRGRGLKPTTHGLRDDDRRVPLDDHNWLKRQRSRWVKYMQNSPQLPYEDEAYTIYQKWRAPQSRRPRTNSRTISDLFDHASSSIRQTLTTVQQSLSWRSRELTALVRSGVPPELRGQVWWVCSGAGEKKHNAPPHLQYLVLCQKARNHPPAAAQEIEKDLFRTFPNIQARETDESVASLRHVLLAYSVRNPAVGYCQSMNFLVAILLLHMEEEQAFWILAAVVEDLLPDYYTESMLGSHVDQRILMRLMEAKLPRLTRHFEELSLPLQTLTFRWFLCLFVTALPLNATLRIWDRFFHEGSKVLFQSALTVMKLFEDQLLQVDDFSQVYDVLRSGESLDPEDFMVHVNADVSLAAKSNNFCDGLVRISHDRLWFGSISAEQISRLRERCRGPVEEELSRFRKKRKTNGEKTLSEKLPEEDRGHHKMDSVPETEEEGENNTEGVEREGKEGDVDHVALSPQQRQCHNKEDHTLREPREDCSDLIEGDERWSDVLPEEDDYDFLDDYDDSTEELTEGRREDIANVLKEDLTTEEHPSTRLSSSPVLIPMGSRRMSKSRGANEFPFSCSSGSERSGFDLASFDSDFGAELIFNRSGHIDRRYSHRLRVLSAFIDGRADDLLIEDYYEA